MFLSISLTITNETVQHPWPAICIFSGSLTFLKVVGANIITICSLYNITGSQHITRTLKGEGLRDISSFGAIIFISQD